MSYIKRSAMVPYRTDQVFALVNDINSYSKFIPGCTISRVLKKNSNELTAEMNISKAGISKSFITHNIITENKNIMMSLVEGPFSYFAGDWYFIPLSEKASKVEFYLNFEFKNKIIELSFGLLFKEMANSMVMLFARRAKEVYHA